MINLDVITATSNILQAIILSNILRVSSTWHITNELHNMFALKSFADAHDSEPKTAYCCGCECSSLVKIDGLTQTQNFRICISQVQTQITNAQ